MLKSKSISLLLIFCMFSVFLFGYGPTVNAKLTESEVKKDFDQYLKKNINLHRIKQAGTKIEESGAHMKHSTRLSMAASATYIVGSMMGTSMNSPELMLMTWAGATGLSLWSWIEGIKAESDLKKGGKKLKNSVRAQSQFSW